MVAVVHEPRGRTDSTNRLDEPRRRFEDAIAVGINASIDPTAKPVTGQFGSGQHGAGG